MLISHIQQKRDSDLSSKRPVIEPKISKTHVLLPYRYHAVSESDSQAAVVLKVQKIKIHDITNVPGFIVTS